MKRIHLRGRSRRATWTAVALVAGSVVAVAGVAGHGGWKHFHGGIDAVYIQPAPVVYSYPYPVPYPVLEPYPVYVPVVQEVVPLPVVVIAPVPEIIEHNVAQSNSANVNASVAVNNTTQLSMDGAWRQYPNCGCSWEIYPGMDIAVSQAAQVGVGIDIKQE